MALPPRYNLDDLLHLMRRLRDPLTGCPWDIKQTFASIVPFTLEETYEVIDAIERQDYGHLYEELGDLLFQIVFYSQLAAEQEMFTCSDVIHQLVAKLVARHPHVFPQGTLESRRSAVDTHSDQAIKDAWENLKREQRGERGIRGRLGDVPHSLPGLMRAAKLQKRAANHDFDWPDTAGVMDKIKEELLEVEGAVAGGDQVEVAEEIGDLLFSCVNLARHLGVDSETALRTANRKFETRFAAMETRAEELGRNFDDLPLFEKARLWEWSKQQSGG